MNLSSVVSEALERGLKEEEHLQRSESIIKAYKKSFAGFSTDELLLLDGILTEERAPVKRRPTATGRRIRR